MNAQEIVSLLGGPAKVARLVGGITSQAVSQWVRIPAKHCRAIEQATHGAVTVHDSRPDIFGPAPGVSPVELDSASKAA